MKSIIYGLILFVPLFASARTINLDPNIETQRIIIALSVEFQRTGITSSMSLMQVSRGSYFGEATLIVRGALRNLGYEVPIHVSAVRDGFLVSSSCQVNRGKPRDTATLRCWAEAFVHAKRIGGAR